VSSIKELSVLSSTLLEIALILVLVLANGLFAAAEIAVVSARKGRLEQEAERGRHGARVALELADNPNHFLSTVQVGITLISTLAAAFGGASIAEVLADSLRAIPSLEPYAATLALGAVVLVISYVSLILGELVPKRIALQNPEGIAIRLAPLMQGLGRFTGLVVRFLTFSSELVLRLIGRHNIEETPITEDDVMALVREGTAEGTLDTAEADLISSVFAFTERTVRSLMTPRTQVVAIDVNRPLAEVVGIVTESGYSRIPVFQKTLDTVIGIVYARDLLRAVGQSPAPGIDALLRPPIYIPETQRAVAAFQQLRYQRSVLAIVLDEYGQTAGIISMEDLLEELVGEMTDADQAAEAAIVQREDGTYLVDGLLPFIDLAQQLRFPSTEAIMEEHDFETVAGFVIALLGRIPSVGNHVEWEHYRFEVVDMDGKRIDKLLVRPPTVEAGAQTEGILANQAVSPVPQTSHDAAKDED
jgi:putative hemolysin